MKRFVFLIFCIVFCCAMNGSRSYKDKTYSPVLEMKCGANLSACVTESIVISKPAPLENIVPQPPWFQKLFREKLDIIPLLTNSKITGFGIKIKTKPGIGYQRPFKLTPDSGYLVSPAKTPVPNFTAVDLNALKIIFNRGINQVELGQLMDKLEIRTKQETKQ